MENAQNAENPRDLSLLREDFAHDVSESVKYNPNGGIKTSGIGMKEMNKSLMDWMFPEADPLAWMDRKFTQPEAGQIRLNPLSREMLVNQNQSIYNKDGTIKDYIENRQMLSREEIQEKYPEEYERLFLSAPQNEQPKNESTQSSEEST